MALFQSLLLATWHDLSDVRLAEALDDRASFRRFCGFAAGELTPAVEPSYGSTERTAFVRCRAALMSRGLDLGLAGLGPDRALFEAVARQLDARGVVVRAIAAASRPTATRPTSRPIRVQRLRWTG